MLILFFDNRCWLALFNVFKNLAIAFERSTDLLVIFCLDCIGLKKVDSERKSTVLR